MASFTDEQKIKEEDMISFSQSVPLKYQNLDYSGVIENYDWITGIIGSLFENIEQPEVDISFYLGKISCHAKSMKAFKKSAYGQEIRVFSYDLNFKQKISEEYYVTLATVFIDKPEVKIYCDSKEILIDICAALENSLKPKEPEPIVIQQVTNIHNDESVHLNLGDNNTIQDVNIGKSNTIKKDVSASTPKNDYWKPVAQNLTARVIWVVLGALAVALLGYYGINYTDFMKQ